MVSTGNIRRLLPECKEPGHTQQSGGSPGSFIATGERIKTAGNRMLCFATTQGVRLEPMEGPNKHTM